jgi:ketosteroid isomerase-like protein
MTGDHLAIHDLVARFDDAVNRRDAAEFGRLWAPDAVWEIGDPRPMRIGGAEAILSTWRGMIDGTRWLFRGSFAGVVTLDGDRGVGRWPCIETGVFADGESYDNRALYEDIYVREEGRWLFGHRRYLYLWLSSETLRGAAVRLGEEIAADRA